MRKFKIKNNYDKTELSFDLNELMKQFQLLIESIDRGPYKEESILTVGDLREAIKDLDDNTTVWVSTDYSAAVPVIKIKKTECIMPDDTDEISLQIMISDEDKKSLT